MKIRKNSVPCWSIQIALSAVIGWFFGYYLIAGFLSGVVHWPTPLWLRLLLACLIGVFYLLCFRREMSSKSRYKDSW